MRLAPEVLISYPGISGMDGVCHIRIYESQDSPVVIAGELTDNPGTAMPTAIEAIAASVRYHFYPTGRFQLVG